MEGDQPIAAPLGTPPQAPPDGEVGKLQALIADLSAQLAAVNESNAALSLTNEATAQQLASVEATNATLTERVAVLEAAGNKPPASLPVRIGQLIEEIDQRSATEGATAATNHARELLVQARGWLTP